MTRPPDPDADRAEPSLGDTIDGAVRRIVTAIAIAGVAIALAIYSRPGPPRYQAIATPTGIARLDARSGTILLCEGTRCYTVVKRGRRLEKGPAAQTVTGPAAEPTQALPAPAPAPNR